MSLVEKRVVKEDTHQLYKKTQYLLGGFCPRLEVLKSLYLRIRMDTPERGLEGHDHCWVRRTQDGIYHQSLWMDQSLSTHRVPGTGGRGQLQTWDKTQPPFISSSLQLPLHLQLTF